MGAVIASNWFNNNDGLLIIPGDEGGRPHLLRLLFTDSRHYMLPLDGVKAENTEHDRVQTFMNAAYEESRGQWSDTRHQAWYCTTVFNATTTNVPELKRSSTDISEQPLSDIAAEEPYPPDQERTHHEEEPRGLPTGQLTDEVMKNSETEIYFQAPMAYPGDNYPASLEPDLVTKLTRRYKAVKEEFYTRTGRRVITPDNFQQWSPPLLRDAERRSGNSSLDPEDCRCVQS